MSTIDNLTNCGNLVEPMLDLSILNDVQRTAVLHTDGAVQVSAGAGSGKTRVLTYRIAHLVHDKGVKEYRILATTFTNKATEEMRNRLVAMVPSIRIRDIWVSTFHSFCLRILRRFADKLGYQSGFSVYGDAERERLLKSIAKDKGYLIKDDDSDKGRDGSVVKQADYYISDAKNNGIEPSEFLNNYVGIKNDNKIDNIYKEYDKQLLKANALDFDDLLCKVEKLLKSDSDVRELYQRQFEYILVDEFQDTNALQYSIIKMLAGMHKNIFVVGDEDQSIYGWRGANIANIKEFARDFDATVYKLEQNYRSTQSILDGANKIIAHNTNRIDKKLWSDNGTGDKIVYQEAYDESKEAEFCVEKILHLHKKCGVPYSDMAVLMRINALSSNVEKTLLAYNVPYKVYGGFKFFERKEIKDVLAYLKLVNNHNDIDSLLRVASFPKRGIGDSTMAQIRAYLNVSDISAMDMLLSLQSNMDLPSKIIKKLLPLASDMTAITKLGTDDIYKLMVGVIDVLKIEEIYKENTEENTSRRANIGELVNMIAQRRDRDNLSLSDFLDSVTLYSDSDDKNVVQDSVTLATIHSAKGLEWNTVFVVGLEDGIFPSKRSIDNISTLEEERRLMYVAITRACHNLYLLNTVTRYVYGKRDYVMPSRFLSEGSFKIKRTVSNTSNETFGNRADTNIAGSKFVRSVLPVASPNSPKPINAQTSLYKIGQMIVHKKFGKGTIISVESEGMQACATIKFDDSIGHKTLLLAYAPIQIVD